MATDVAKTEKIADTTAVVDAKDTQKAAVENNAAPAQQDKTETPGE